MIVLVLGATGGTGRAIVLEAQRLGHDVRALVRSEAKIADLVSTKLFVGDARDETALSSAVEGCDAVICSLGTPMSPFSKVTLLSTATAALVRVMQRHGVRRLVCITGMGAGNSRGHGGLVFDRLIMPLLLRNVYADKDRQEKLVRDSGLDWVLVRPSVLNNKLGHEQVRALTHLDGFKGGSIAREDVAHFVVEQLADDGWLNKSPLITS